MERVIALKSWFIASFIVTPLLVSLNVHAAASDRRMDIEALFSSFDQGHQPGVAVLVMQEDQVFYAQGFGYADLEGRKKIDTRALFRLGSISKQFTTMAIMQLAAAGHLEYDDLLSEHIPELAHWPHVTIRQLMNHTSGVPDYYEEAYYTDFVQRYDETFAMPQNTDLIEIMSNYSDPDFPPGDQYIYNNAGYELLATVVERTSGEAFGKFLKEKIFKPAGMETANTFNSLNGELPRRVLGYSPTEQGFMLNDFDPFNDMLGAGGVYASIDDLTAWFKILRNNSLLSPSAMAEAFYQTRLNDGSLIDYGFGWDITPFQGHASLGHSGSWVGFRTALRHLPELDISVAVLSNRSDVDASELMNSVTNFMVDGRGSDFMADESRQSAMNHHRRIPDNEHWWNVRGDEMGWMHRHTQEMFPTQPVYRGGPVRELEYNTIPAISDASIETPQGPMPFRRFLASDQSTAMGVVILYQGQIAFESYPRMREYEKVTYWSTTKILAGAIVRLLEEQGRIDISQPIEAFVPQLASSVHAGTTIENILDMATGVDCAENYTDPDSCYYRYSEAIGDNIRDSDSPDDPYKFLAEVAIERTNDQGKKFVYSGATNFLLMWAIEEITGYTLADAVTKEFWRQIGAEHDAAFIAYRYGIPLSHGGFISTMRDLARLGLLYTPSWPVVSQKQIISAEHLSAIMTANRSNLRPTAYAWGDRDSLGFISHGGWGGQGLIIHPERDIVAVFTSYTKTDYSEVNLQLAVKKVLRDVFIVPNKPVYQSTR